MDLDISSLSLKPDGGLGLSFVKSSCLRRIKMCGVEIPYISWDNAQLPGRMQITHLILHRMPINFCILLLMQCPNLVEFRSVCPSLYSWEPRDFPHIDVNSEPISLPRLQHFRWDFTCERSSLVYPLLRFQNLRVIELYSHPILECDHLEVLRPMLPNFSTTLSCLKLDRVRSWTSESAGLIFHHTTKLRTFSISDCDLVTATAVISALNPIPRDADQHLIRLPLLKRLTLEGVNPNPDNEQGQQWKRKATEDENELATEIARTFRNRGVHARFSLELSRNGKDQWRAKTLKTCQQLREEGLVITIWADKDKEGLIT